MTSPSILLVQCCVCLRVNRNDVWTPHPGKLPPPCSHGYCPDCFEQSMQAFTAWLAQHPGQYSVRRAG